VNVRESSVFASELAVKVEDDLARLTFLVRLPGDAEKKIVADVLLPRAAFDLALGIARGPSHERRGASAPSVVAMTHLGGALTSRSAPARGDATAM
jgi:hypothetical protein